ncbi:MAG: hypothetical protein HPY64_16790 [Anaerolineae bacterium]|nr:hypothetical protein [Anaerolineae bacterium]
MSQSIRDRLNSSDPAVRREAIIALGRSKNPRALPLLRQVYDSDPDPALRDLALRAARHIRQSARPAAEQPSAPAPVERRSLADERYARYEDPSASAPAYILPVFDEASQAYTTDGYQIVEPKLAEEVTVAPGDRTRARALVKRANELNEEGTLRESLNILIAALELDPALIYDPAAQKLAEALIGQEGRQAAEILADPRRREMYVGHVPEKRIERVKRTGGVSWGEVWLDVGIYFVLLALASVLLLSATPTFLQTLAARLNQPLPPEVSALLNPALVSENLPAVLLGSLGSALWSVISLLIMLWLAQLVAVGLGGHGTLTQTYHAVIPVQTALLVISSAVMALLMFTGAWEALGIGGLILGLVAIIWPVRALARVHGFGALSGCLALFLGGIAAAILGALLSVVVWALGGAALLPLLPAG